MPSLFIIAGANGAGKTTASKIIFPELLDIIEFVNADEIAKGLSPFNPEGVSFEAGRIMLRRIHQLISERKNFAFETTLSSKTYLKLIEEVKAHTYSVVLIFLYLNSSEIAKQRVKKRVNEGGHHIPDEVIERRYLRGIQNLELFLNLVDDWYLYDNSSGNYELIVRRVNEEKIIFNFELWKRMCP